MNWIERLYEIKGKDFYSQNGEGLLLEYVLRNIGTEHKHCVDIGGGDGFYLSNTYHILKAGFTRTVLDRETGQDIDADTIHHYLSDKEFDLVSIDIDGNDYWVLDEILPAWRPRVVIAEFNPAFTDSRAIKYKAWHVWAGDDYYGFSFEAGKKLAEKHGYEIIFNVANMNLIMVRKDLITVTVPPVTYKQDNFFKASNRPDEDWIWI